MARAPALCHCKRNMNAGKEMAVNIGGEGVSTNVTVPMVGKIVAVTVKVGDKVAENDPIATLEAMKMEMPIVAPVDGIIKEIRVSPGREVETDDIIAVIE